MHSEGYGSVEFVRLTRYARSLHHCCQIASIAVAYSALCVHVASGTTHALNVFRDRIQILNTVFLEGGKRVEIYRDSNNTDD